MYIESGLSGAHHDMAVLKYSDFGQKFLNTDRLGGYFVLGDSVRDLYIEPLFVSYILYDMTNLFPFKVSPILSLSIKEYKSDYKEVHNFCKTLMYHAAIDVTKLITMTESNP